MPHAVQSLIIFPYGPYFIAGGMFYLTWRTRARRLRVGCADNLSSAHLRRGVQNRTNFMSAVTPDTAWDVIGFLILAFAMFSAIALRAFAEMKSRFWLSLGGFTYPLYLVHNEVGKAVFRIAEPAANEWLRLAAALSRN